MRKYCSHLNPDLCMWSSSSLSPPADGVHTVDGWNPERLVLWTRQAVTERAQTQALVVAATGTLHNVAHGLSVRWADGGGEGEGALVNFLWHCGGKQENLLHEPKKQGESFLGLSWPWQGYWLPGNLVCVKLQTAHWHKSWVTSDLLISPVWMLLKSLLESLPTLNEKLNDSKRSWDVNCSFTWNTCTGLKLMTVKKRPVSALSHCIIVMQKYPWYRHCCLQVFNTWTCTSVMRTTFIVYFDVFIKPMSHLLSCLPSARIYDLYCSQTPGGDQDVLASLSCHVLHLYCQS